MIVFSGYDQPTGVADVKHIRVGVFERRLGGTRIAGRKIPVRNLIIYRNMKQRKSAILGCSIIHTGGWTNFSKGYSKIDFQGLLGNFSDISRGFC